MNNVSYSISEIAGQPQRSAPASPPCRSHSISEIAGQPQQPKQIQLLPINIRIYLWRLIALINTLSACAPVFELIPVPSNQEQT